MAIYIFQIGRLKRQSSGSFDLRLLNLFRQFYISQPVLIYYSLGLKRTLNIIKAEN